MAINTGNSLQNLFWLSLCNSEDKKGKTEGRSNEISG